MNVDRVLVRELTTRLSGRLVDAIETDTASSNVPGFGAADGQRRVGVREDRARLELLMGRWMAEEIARLNQTRLQGGDGLLDEHTERELRAAAYAETVGAGPLEPYMHDPEVEEIDVNSHRVTWVSYSDGRKESLGQLWDSADDLYAFQRRLTLSMGVAESRLDEQSPMVTLQAADGSRIVMVLGGPGRSGVSSQPRIAIRRFTVNRVGLDGLADRGLFPRWVVPQLEALVQAGMTILISGGPGAGKTTLLKSCSAQSPRWSESSPWRRVCSSFDSKTTRAIRTHPRSTRARRTPKAAVPFPLASWSN